MPSLYSLLNARIAAREPIDAAIPWNSCFIVTYLASDRIAAFRRLDDRPVGHGEKTLGALKRSQTKVSLGQKKVRRNHLDAAVPEYFFGERESLGAAIAK